jgi:hypothetical protein
MATVTITDAPLTIEDPLAVANGARHPRPGAPRIAD